MTHICIAYLTIIASDNGLSPSRRQAIIWTNDGILLIRPLGTNFSEILIEIHTFSIKKVHLKMSSAKWCLFCLGLIELKAYSGNHFGRIRSIPWLLKPGLLVSTGHPQLSYWLFLDNKSFSCTKEGFQQPITPHRNVKIYKSITTFPENNSACWGLIFGPDCCAPDNIRCLLEMTTY